MKFIALFLLLVSASLQAFAGKNAPLPEELLNAKTIFITNQTGYQEVTDSAYEALTKWNRFSISKSKTDADLVIVFTLITRLDEGTSLRRTVMQVFAKNSEEPLFQTTQKRDAFLGNYGTSAKNCINQLKGRMKDH